MASECVTTAPAFSTPADHLLAHVIPEVSSAEKKKVTVQARPDHELRERYEIARTAADLHAGAWRTIALQFPDAMLGDAPWVSRALTAALSDLDNDKPSAADAREKKVKGLYIMADTSYSACCVDEIAAAHVKADVVVHYGRCCLSPTSRLPVVHVFTKHELDREAVLRTFAAEFGDLEARVVLMADVTYQDHVEPLAQELRRRLGYTRLLSTDIVHDPAGRLPNRRLLDAHGKEYAPDGEVPALMGHAVFHLSTPPTALLLALASRVRSLHILPTPLPESNPLPCLFTGLTTSRLLGRRYARVLSLATAGVIGILVNTLSVSNYLSSIESTRKIIAAAGKKSYTVVVGKLNPAKLANFAEVDGWVVVGCWESSLVDDDDDPGYFKPVVTPFELMKALQGDERRVWDGAWWGGMEGVDSALHSLESRDEDAGHGGPSDEGDEKDEDEDEPPEFDLRTGQLVSHSRPMRVANGYSRNLPAAGPKGPSSALTLRPKTDVAKVKGVVSPGAEYLRSHRTWQGLGTDHDLTERSTTVEEGRSGVARGYTVGKDGEKR